MKFLSITVGRASVKRRQDQRIGWGLMLVKYFVEFAFVHFGFGIVFDPMSFLLPSTRRAQLSLAVTPRTSLCSASSGPCPSFGSLFGWARSVPSTPERAIDAGLTGTTWYEVQIRPLSYWSLWTDWLIHAIHWSLLEHIKSDAEAAARAH